MFLERLEARQLMQHQRNNILVIGDAMIDSHIFGEVDRISPEAPVPVVVEQETSHTLGGAANVAAQLSVAADKVILAYKNIRCSVGGEKETLKKLLDSKNIIGHKLWKDVDKSNPCVPVKQRIWVRNQQICRVDKENTEKPNQHEEHEWIESIWSLIKDEEIDKVIFSDYDKGTLTDNMITYLATKCHMRGIITVLDPKRHTFPTLDFLTIVKPNDKELLSTGMKTATEVSKNMLNTIVVKTSGPNETIIALNGETIDLISPENVNVVDTCGAGDVHIAVLTLKFDGKNIKDAVVAANMAAGMSVKHVGCYTLTSEEVAECLSRG